MKILPSRCHYSYGMIYQYQTCFNIVVMLTSKHAIIVLYYGRVNSWSSVDSVFSLQVHRYEVGVPVVLFCGNSSKLYRWKGGYNYFVFTKRGLFIPSMLQTLILPVCHYEGLTMKLKKSKNFH